MSVTLKLCDYFGTGGRVIFVVSPTKIWKVMPSKNITVRKR